MSDSQNKLLMDDISPFEEELRRVYGSVMAPQAPAQWSLPAAKLTAGRRPPSEKPFRASRRIAPVAVAVAAALVIAILVNRSPLQPQPVLAVQLQPAGTALVCKLPISALSEDHTTGFIVMNHGQATFEPVKTNGTTYIPRLGVWADVLPQQVAPDGRAYVREHYDYSTGHMTILITDARGTRTLLDTTAPSLIEPFAYTASGDILVEDHSRPAGSIPGPLPDWNLKLLNPATGQLRPLPFLVPNLPQGNSEAGYNRNSNSIWYSAFGREGTTVSRFDLGTGQMTEWFNPGDVKGTVEVVATDSEGAPIIQVATSDIWHADPAHRSGIGIETLLVTAPHQFTVLNHGRSGDPGIAGPFSPLSATSGDTVWLATNDGAIWAYRTGEGLHEIAKVTTSNQGAPGVAISGPCI